MDRATEIAYRILPAAGSEWPLSGHGYAIALEHAANIIRNELDAERQRVLYAVRDAAGLGIALKVQEATVPPWASQAPQD